MKSSELIIICFAIILGAAIIAGAIFLTNDSPSTNSSSNNNTTNVSVNNTTALQTGDVVSAQPVSNSNSKSDNVVSEEVKYNGQANDGSYFKEVSYSDGGFRQYNTSSGELIGSSYESDQKYLPSME